ncbi:MAG: DNA polymerase/3'-5' exonuclease PolX [Phycisphaerales bacterium]|nr:DNA polymerase/3'-5' exonuclease PolX [Phycisphaerales bacterium]
MSVNAAAAQALDDIAKMMDLLGEESFKAIAHSRASRLVGDMGEDVSTLDKKALMAIPGIGAKIADKIIEFCTTGRMREHEELAARVPPGLLALMNVPNLGPKTLRTLWQEGGITDAASLEKAIADGSILTLPRMGAKSVEKIRQSLEFAKTSGERLWLGRAWALAAEIVDRMRAHQGVAKAEAAGSLRRGKETVGDLDVLVCLKKGANAAEVSEWFRASPGVTQVLAAGESKSSVRVALNHDTGRWKLEGKEGEAKAGPSIQVDLRVLPVESWGSGLMYFTGSKEHNIRLRERALAQGMTLNEWGLFPEDDEKTPPQSRGVKPVASATEEEIYATLGLAWTPPEAREDRGELDHKGAWRLVEVGDIKAELHAHTTASDGTMSIEQLASAAKARGFHTIAVTDHSRSSAIANGLDEKRLAAHVKAVHAAKVPGITILAGSEVDILADGRLDYDDEVLAGLDVVVASPHAALSQDSAAATSRLIKAISNPSVHILGHPTGRLLNKRKGLEPDMKALIEAAVAHDVALEINAHWMRLDLRDVHVRLAVEAGCKIAINCDTHEPRDMDNLRFGVMTGRRGWLTPELCINCWEEKKLHAWLKKKRK